MSFLPFWEAFQRLEELGKVLRIDEEVAADFEAPLLIREVSSRTGKAVLLSRVRGKEAPLVSGVYFRKSPEDLGLGNIEELCQRYLSWVSPFDRPPMDTADKLAVLATISWIVDRFPRIVQFPSSEYEVRQGYDLDLTKLPALRHSPKEEAPSITNPVIILRAAASKSIIAVSHPVEIVDERTALIAAPVRSPLQQTLSEAATTQSKVNAEIVIGAPPSVQLASMIEWIAPADTFTLTGVLSGSPVLLAKFDEDFFIPLGSEVVLLGEIEPGDSRPGGRLLQEDGYLAEENALPVFKLRKVLIHKKALFYASIIDAAFSDVVQLSRWRDRLLLAHLQRLSPIVKDLRVLPETAFRAIAVSVRQARTRELLSLGMRILSMRVTSRLSTVIFVGEEVDVNSSPAILSSLIEHVDPERGVYQISYPRGKDLSPEEPETIIIATSFSRDRIAGSPGYEVLHRVENMLKQLLPEAQAGRI